MTMTMTMFCGWEKGGCWSIWHGVVLHGTAWHCVQSVYGYDDGMASPSTAPELGVRQCSSW